MNKQFPWGIVVSLVAIVLISVGGAYLLYRIANEASPFKPVVKLGAPATSTPPPAPAAAAGERESGFLVLSLRASVEMSPDTGEVAFDLAMENKGFAMECPGKVVTLDHRATSKDFWSEAEGALAKTDSVICLAATEKATVGDMTGPSSPSRTVLDDNDASQYPDAVVESQGKSAFVQTGKANYMLYVGGVSFKSCAAGCDAGAAVGVSVTKVRRALSEDRFVFSVPAGDNKTVGVAATVPSVQ